MEERRKHQRYNATYPLEDERNSSSSDIALVDVSRGGVSFSMPREVALNETMSIKMFLKNKMFTVAAVVVRVKKVREGLFSIGAMFMNTSEEFDELLEKELREITQHHRESNLYKRRDITFEKASKEYLAQ